MIKAVCAGDAGADEALDEVDVIDAAHATHAAHAVVVAVGDVDVAVQVRHGSSGAVELRLDRRRRRATEWDVARFLKIGASRGPGPRNLLENTDDR